MSEYKMYVPTDKENVKIKFSISHNKEPYKWSTNEPLQIGYRVTGVPVTIEGSFESFEAFSGFGDNLVACGRRSKGKLNASIKMLEDNMDRYKQYFKERGYKFPENE